MDRDLSSNVGEPFFVNGQGLLLAGAVTSRRKRPTFKCSTSIVGSLPDLIRLSVGLSELVCRGPGDLAVGGLVVQTLDDQTGDWGSSRCDGTVGFAESRSAARSLTIGDNLYLVGYSILGSHFERRGTRDFAVRRLVVDTLDTGGWYGGWRCPSLGGGFGCGRGCTFVGVGEVVIG